MKKFKISEFFNFICQNRTMKFSLIFGIILIVSTGLVVGLLARKTHKNTPRSDDYLFGIEGIRIGHAHDESNSTGCTVIVFDKTAVAGVDVRGSAPGTRETDLLSPTNTVTVINAILLTGGSAFGLDSESGVMKCMEEDGKGFSTSAGIVPIVPGAPLPVRVDVQVRSFLRLTLRG